jgi:hypothetical protein
MDRRETLKSLLVGSLATGLALNSCGTLDNKKRVTDTEIKGYGRTKEEEKRDKRILSEEFLNAHELATLAVLIDIILPPIAHHPSTDEAAVVGFVDFIVKDIPKHQLPIRGGIMWLDNRSNKRFNIAFKSIEEKQRKELCDEIAFPDVKTPELQIGIKFFNLMRNLTLTGYYTSEAGMKTLGYLGNQPNIWDGVPEDVLKSHGLSYEPEWLVKCIDQSKRNDIATWDENGDIVYTT